MTEPKILTLDIETRPITAYVWSLHEQYIGVEQIKDPGGILCWSAKWVGKNNKPYFGASWESDKFLEPLFDMINDASAVVHYNGARFDMPKIRGEGIYRGYPALAPVKQIDCWRVTNSLGYASSKLAFIGPHLLEDKKVSTGGFQLWVDVMNGVKKAQANMKKYNIHDVVLTEKLYLRLKPYMTNHPILAPFDEASCSLCGSENLQKRGVRYTKGSVVQRIQCQDCGHWDTLAPRRYKK